VHIALRQASGRDSKEKARQLEEKSRKTSGGLGKSRRQAAVMKKSQKASGSWMKSEKASSSNLNGNYKMKHCTGRIGLLSSLTGEPQAERVDSHALIQPL
jgi:hypothetical protein